MEENMNERDEKETRLALGEQGATLCSLGR